MPSEKELDLALANKLESSPEFLNWLVGHTKFAGRGTVFHSCRSNNPWGTHPFPITDPVTGETSTSNRESETDVLLVVKDSDNHLLGIHIENKIGTGKFTKLQPAMYTHRAAHWVKNPRYGDYTEFDTVLVAPEAFRQRNADQAALFGCFISHESVARYVSLFQAATGAA